MYWDWLSAAKFVAAGAILFGLGWVWQARQDVLGAYTAQTNIDEVQIPPLSLSAATIPDGEQGRSFSLAVAPDLADASPARLAYLEPESTPAAVSAGSSSLSGKVVGLAADDIGGRVLLTRVTSGGAGEVSVPIEDDGSWSARNIVGGGYRVRAFVPSLRASNGSTVLFPRDDQDRKVNLAVTTPPQDLVLDADGTDDVVIGSESVAAVTVGRQVVTPDGRSVVSPVAGLDVQATFSPIVSLLSADTSTTDQGGAVRFLVRCDLAGTAAVTLVAGEQRAVLTIPPCLTPEQKAELEEVDDG